MRDAEGRGRKDSGTRDAKGRGSRSNGFPLHGLEFLSFRDFAKSISAKGITRLDVL